MRLGAAVLLALLPLCGQAAVPGGGYVALPGGTFRSALRYEDAAAGTPVAPYRLMRRPVTNAEFLQFVRAHPEWQRGRAPVVLAEPRYLSQWAGALELGDAQPQQPVEAVHQLGPVVAGLVGGDHFAHSLLSRKSATARVNAGAQS